jgi:branched-chain amino acid transport system ATP-binding protein
VLRVESLNVSYGNVVVLRDVSLSVNDNEIVTLIGANGAGKTTLLMAISGIVRSQSGAIFFADRGIEGMPAHDIVALGIAQVSQERRLFRDMSVEENLKLGAYRLGRKANLRRSLDQIYSYFGVLGRRKDQRAGSLSGGEQAMLAVGRALMSEPLLLLLDEPSAGLSPIMVEELTDMIQNLFKESGLPILIVEQNATLALDISHRAYLLETGRVVASGTAEELAGSDAVRVAYLGL